MLAAGAAARKFAHQEQFQLMRFDVGRAERGCGGTLCRTRTWARLLLRVRDRVRVRVLEIDGTGGEACRSIWHTKKTVNMGRCIEGLASVCIFNVFLDCRL